MLGSFGYSRTDYRTLLEKMGEKKKRKTDSREEGKFRTLREKNFLCSTRATSVVRVVRSRCACPFLRPKRDCLSRAGEAGTAAPTHFHGPNFPPADNSHTFARQPLSRREAKGSEATRNSAVYLLFTPPLRGTFNCERQENSAERVPVADKFRPPRSKPR